MGHLLSETKGFVFFDAAGHVHESYLLGASVTDVKEFRGADGRRTFECVFCGERFDENHIYSPSVADTYAERVKRHGDPRFYALIEEIAELHSRKSHDYTPAGDPLANFHRSERFGVPAWKGTLVRMGDKFGRLEQLASGKEPSNESLRDTLVDLAVYSLLCVLLLEDAK